MKYLLFICFLIPAIVNAQMQPVQPTFAELAASGQEGPQPFKGANTIHIYTTDSASVAYDRFAAILLEAGYSLKMADKSLRALSTESRPAPRYNVSHHLRASVVQTASGAEIRIRDSFALPSAAAVSSVMAGEQETVCRGMQGSPFMVCWAEIQRLASLYPKGIVMYSKKP